MEEICIVSYGGVFPGAKNPTELFKNIMQGNQAIHDFREPVEEEAFYQKLNHFYDPDKKAKNKTYSSMGAYLDRRWANEFAQKFNLDPELSTTSELFALEAADQVLSPLKGKVNFEKFEIIIGMASIDHECLASIETGLLENEIGVPKDSPEYKKILSKLKKAKVPKKKFICSTYILESIRKQFSIKGLSFYTDAACASSLAAIFCAQQRLRSGATEFVLTGGIECNLSPFLEVMFSKAGVLSSKMICPFGAQADGMNHGEAVAMLALCTVSTAEKYGLKVQGVIKNCQGSSDGLRGGATEPTLEGQILAYTRTYPQGKPTKIHYLEAHGTGTSVGDRTEIQSLQRFFGGGVPVGSVKSNIGHTIGTAGTASVVKCLEIIKNRTIPPAKYFKDFPNTFKTELYVNKEPIALPINEDLQFAVSSFGFGGTNYHMHLSEKVKSQSANQIDNSYKEKVYLCAQEEVRFDHVQELLEKSKIRIPPKAIPQIDPMVLGGILAIDQIISKNGIFLDPELKKQIAVISAGSLTLDYAWKLYQTLALDELALDLKDTKYAEKVNSLVKQSPEFTADTGPGVLNNLVAGRAAKMFDLSGVTFHIDADLLSRATAHIMAKNIAANQKTAVFVLSANEIFDEKLQQYVRTGLYADFFASADVAIANDLPIISELKDIQFEG